METGIAIYNPDTRMKNVPQDKKKIWATAMIIRMHDMAGQNIDNQNLELIVRELLRDLDTRYKLLAMEEVETIIGNGIRGDYGNYYGLSVASISKWFKAYMESGAHGEYLSSKVTELKLMLPEKTGLTDQEVDKIMISGCIRCFTEYTSTGKFNDYGRENYYFLKKKGLIKLTDDQIKKYLAAARVQYKEQMERQTASLNRDDAKDAAKILATFKEVNDKNANIQSIGQYNAMADFFKSLVKKKVNIEDLLK